MKDIHPAQIGPKIGKGHQPAGTGPDQINPHKGIRNFGSNAARAEALKNGSLAHGGPADPDSNASVGGFLHAHGHLGTDPDGKPDAKSLAKRAGARLQVGRPERGKAAYDQTDKTITVAPGFEDNPIVLGEELAHASQTDAPSDAPKTLAKGDRKNPAEKEAEEKGLATYKALANGQEPPKTREARSAQVHFSEEASPVDSWEEPASSEVGLDEPTNDVEERSKLRTDIAASIAQMNNHIIIALQEVQPDLLSMMKQPNMNEAMLNSGFTAFFDGVVAVIAAFFPTAGLTTLIGESATAFISSGKGAVIANLAALAKEQIGISSPGTIGSPQGATSTISELGSYLTERNTALGEQIRNAENADVGFLTETADALVAARNAADTFKTKIKRAATNAVMSASAEANATPAYDDITTAVEGDQRAFMGENFVYSVDVNAAGKTSNPDWPSALSVSQQELLLDDPTTLGSNWMNLSLENMGLAVVNYDQARVEHLPNLTALLEDGVDPSTWPIARFMDPSIFEDITSEGGQYGIDHPSEIMDGNGEESGMSDTEQDQDDTSGKEGGDSLSQDTRQQVELGILALSGSTYAGLTPRQLGLAVGG